MFRRWLLYSFGSKSRGKKLTEKGSNGVQAEPAHVAVMPPATIRYKLHGVSRAAPAQDTAAKPAVNSGVVRKPVSQKYTLAKKSLCTRETIGSPKNTELCGLIHVKYKFIAINNKNEFQA